MTTLRAAAQQALEALEMSRRFVYADNRPQCDDAITALRAALEQPEQEPLTDTYVQEVPDKCDRIVWRGYYFCLPVNSTSKPEQPEQDTDCHAQGICQRSGYGIGRPEQEPVAYACFKNGELQTELVGTEADVNFWCASDEPEMQGMVKGALYTHPPRREPLNVTDLQQALVGADLVDPDAIDDPEGFDNGFTLQQIDALHSRLMQTTPPTTTTQPEPK